MQTALDEIALRSGERMAIRLIRPPEDSYADRITARYIHKGPPWHEDIVRRARGEHVKVALDSFFVGEINGEIVGGVWTTTPRDARDVGTLGHVFTAEAHRQKGICDALMRPTLEAFTREGGQAMYLATGNPVARRVYERYGFRLYNPPRGDGGIFQWVVGGEKNFEARYYRHTGKARVRAVHAGDLPRLEALYNAPTDWLVRDYRLDLFRETGFEGQFLALMAAIEQQSAVCAVLEAPSVQTNPPAPVRIVAACCAHRHANPHQSHLATIDFFAAPAYRNQAADLIRHTADQIRELGPDLLVASVAECDQQKAESFIAAGFSGVATLADQLKDDSNSLALLIFRRKL